jgi:hypothetical protein
MRHADQRVKTEGGAVFNTHHERASFGEERSAEGAVGVFDVSVVVGEVEVIMV